MKQFLKSTLNKMLQEMELKLVRVKKNGLPIDFDEEIHGII